MDWDFKNGQLHYQNSSYNLVLKGNIQFNLQLAKEHSLHPYFLYEWNEYRIINIPNEKDENKQIGNIQVFFGDDEAKKDDDGPFWSYTYKNFVGKSEIRITSNNRLLTSVNVEIISPKFVLDNDDDPYFYPHFHRRLIDDLSKYQLNLPLVLASPTYIGVEDIPFPPNLFTLFHQIIFNYRKIVDGLNTILMKPYRVLTTEDIYVHLNEVETLTPEIYLSILQNPDYLIQTDKKYPLSQKLKGYLPQKTLQYTNIETFDTPENRFVKRFIKELHTSIRKIEDSDIHHKYKEELLEKWEKFTELKSNIKMTLASRFFGEVNDTEFSYTFTSQVLLKREGYRELLQVHNDLLLSKSPFFTLIQEVINERNIADMYEFWCLFELIKRLSVFLECPYEECKLIIETHITGGLKYTKTKVGIGEYQLIYNKRFTRKGGSYSLTLRPDFTLQKGKHVLAVFDSKFRFAEVENIAALMDEEETAIDEGDAEKIAKRADIYKMHTYRDALEAHSAVILYPGTKDLFYIKESGEQVTDYDNVLSQIFNFEDGIGYLSFVPSHK